MDIFFIDLFKRFSKIRNSLLKEDSLKIDLLPQLQEKLIINIEQKKQLTDQLNFKEIVRFMFLGQFKSQTFMVIFFYILESLSRNFMSISLSLLLSNILTQNENAAHHALIVILLSIIANISRHQAITKSMEFSAKCRFTLLNKLYQKLLHSKSSSIDQGKLIGLVSSDISMLEYYLMLIFQIFIVPISFTFGSIILCYRFQGLIGLIPILLISLMYPFQTIIQKKQITFTKQYKQFQDQRLKLQSEMVENIKIIKIYNLSNKLKQQIINIRKEEEKYLFKAQMVQLLDRTFNFFAQIWASLIFFIILYIMEQQLNVPAMIATIQQLQYLKVNCVQQVSYGIQSFLNIKMTITRYLESYNSIQKFEQRIIVKEQNQILFLQNISLQWNNKETFLNNFSLNLDEKDFILIVGRIGCGKSSFLQTLLNVGPSIIKGQITERINITKAYVEQDPILFEDTIQNNITFGKIYLEELYLKVIDVVCLREDIDKMSQKDQTIINDRSTTLSGGQKVRIALARALYSLADLIILDDPFSSLDKEVQENIFINMRKFTSNYHFTQTNKYPAIILTTNSNTIINQFKSYYKLENCSLNLIENSEYQKPISVQTIKQQVYQQQINPSQTKSFQNQSKQSQKQNNYIYYFTKWSKKKFISYFLVIITIVLNVDSEILYNLYYNRITQIHKENQFYILQILSLICLGAFLNNYLKYNVNSFGCFQSNSHIHNNMIESISNAKLSYFDQNPNSTILSKFSTDMTIADNMLSTTLYDFWELGSYFIVSLFSLVILNPKFIFLMIITIILNYYIFFNYKTLILKSQELDQQTKAPLIDFFKRTISGLKTIQIFQQKDMFEKRFNQAINNVVLSNTTYYYSQRLFGLSIDIVGLFVQQIGIFLIYQNKQNETFAQALLLLMIFNENQQWFLRQTLSFMTHMNCIKRMQELLYVDQEQNQKSLTKQDIINLKGNINFKNVSLKFGEDYALNNLDFVVNEGERVGIIGRTGAGKSSITSVIFKLYDIETAEILEIDHHDLRNLSIHDIRNNISIIPQNPLIFKDSIRNNIDLHQNHNDDEIIKVLSEVGLNKIIINKSLNEQFGELSSGQKQLVSLSRVLLQDKNIIIMDEATSNIDSETDQIIQQVILQKLKGKTIITIAHKTETILNYDKVYLISNGKVEAVGIPSEVLSRI